MLQFQRKGFFARAWFRVVLVTPVQKSDQRRLRGGPSYLLDILGRYCTEPKLRAVVEISQRHEPERPKVGFLSVPKDGNSDGADISGHIIERFLPDIARMVVCKANCNNIELA